MSAEILSAIRATVEKELPGTTCVATGGGGHFTIDVTGQVFAGKSMLESQRLVLKALAPLLAGPSAPIHAVDKLTTKVA